MIADCITKDVPQGINTRSKGRAIGAQPMQFEAVSAKQEGLRNRWTSQAEKANCGRLIVDAGEETRVRVFEDHLRGEFGKGVFVIELHKDLGLFDAEFERNVFC